MPSAERVVQTAHEQVKEVGRRIRSRRLRRSAALLALTGFALLVQGCGEEEQSRPLVYQKGTYLGQPDEKLDQDQIEALRQRAARQGS